MVGNVAKSRIHGGKTQQEVVCMTRARTTLLQRLRLVLLLLLLLLQLTLLVAPLHFLRTPAH